MNIREYLKDSILLTDGAFGTYYTEIAEAYNEPCECANISNPDIIHRIHEEYINAGAKLIRSNTFASNTSTLNVGIKDLEKNIEAGFNIAKNAAAGKVFVAADIGPIPIKNNEYTDVRREYRIIADTFLKCGADIFIFETFSEISDVVDTAAYIKSKNPDAFILTQFCVNRYGYTRLGIGGNKIVSSLENEDSIDAIGFNCGIGTAHMNEFIKKLDYTGSKYLSVMPNSGYPEIIRDRAVYLDNAAYFAENMKYVKEAGADIIGGCCGTNPHYIRKMSELIDMSKNHKKIYTGPEKNVLKNKNTDIKNPFMEMLYSGKRTVAVELDPPYDASVDKIMENATILKNTDYMDIVTFADSPSGRARVDSILMSVMAKNEINVPVMPHICCRDRNAISMRSQILGAYVNGIRNFLVVTGDPIPSADRINTTSVFDFNSIKLMEFIKHMNEEHFFKDPVYYGGALNHGRKNIDKEIERMQKKIDAGASYFLTQPVYSDEDVERIRYIKSQVDTKILCGIMPLVSYRNASFIKNEMTGMNVPDEVLNRYKEDMTREEGEMTGIEISREIIKKLDGISDGIYFMVPFNRAHLVEACLK